MKILISGGFGNQLFQYSFAHYLHAHGISNLELLPDPSPRKDRPFRLGPLLGNCEHLELCEKGMSSSELFFRKVVFGATKFALIRLFLMPISKFITLAPSDPYAYINKIPKARSRKMINGYFQNWQYVQQVHKTVSLEIAKSLEQVCFPDYVAQVVSQEKNLFVMHFRRGADLQEVSQTMGVLDLKYYENIYDQFFQRNKRKDSVVVGISDDVTNFNQSSFNIKVDHVWGPDTLDDFQALKLMSTANVLVTANSTFSWWGGVLAEKKGGIVYMPHPWFKNWHEPVGDAFKYPRFRVAQATFI